MRSLEDFSLEGMGIDMVNVPCKVRVMTGIFFYKVICLQYFAKESICATVVAGNALIFPR